MKMSSNTNDDYYYEVYDYAYNNGYYKNPHYISGYYIINYVIDKYFFNTVLDIGCSKGKSVEILSRNKKDIIGIDASSVAVSEARKLGRNVEKIIVTNLPFKDNYFDMILCFDILEHILPEDVDIAISEIVRVSNKYIAIQISNSKKIFTSPFEGIKIKKFTKPCPSVNSVGWWKRKFISKDCTIDWQRGNMFIVDTSP